MKVLPIVKTSKNMLLYAERCKRSWDYFHPEYPMHIVLMEDWKNFMTDIGMQSREPLKFSMTVGLFYGYMKMMTENYDIVIHLDADTFITGRFDDMFTDDYDLAISDSASVGLYDSGVWATRIVGFIRDFFFTNSAGTANDCHVFRLVVHSYIGNGKNVKILSDPKYGAWYSERSRQWWNQLVIKDDELWTPESDNRKVKILHWAGGCPATTDRFSCSYFSEEVKQWLNKISGDTSFTDTDSESYSNWVSRIYRWNK